MFQLAKPVWNIDSESVNQYVVFQQRFSGINPKVAALAIRADSQYVVWLNGHFIGTNQYADYPFYPVFDTYKLKSEWFSNSDNLITCLGYCQNEDSSTYLRGKPSIIFEISTSEGVLVFSGEDTICSSNTGYRSGPVERITPQLSYSFDYDCTQYTGWIDTYQGGQPEWEHANCIERYDTYYPRPVKKTTIQPIKPARIRTQGIYTMHGGETPAQRVYYASLRPYTIDIAGDVLDIMLPSDKGATVRSPKRLLSDEGCFVLIDLGCETAGYLTINIEVPERCRMDIGYGEHVEDLRVRSFVGGRHFGCSLVLERGRNIFTYYIKRIAARYIQIHIPLDEFHINYVGIQSVEYPVKITSVPSCLDRLEQKIYNVSVDTLRLCMHEHYEDCPWREQALYAMDARNQMLCGYYAFEEFSFARESLRLLAYGLRPDGLLELCAPAKVSVNIPSFSLMWICALQEYGEYSRDTEFIKDMFPTATRILHTFMGRAENELIPVFEGYWNFYEWADGLDGTRPRIAVDAALNAFYAMAIHAMCRICDQIGEYESMRHYQSTYTRLQAAYNRTFWDTDRKAYRLGHEHSVYSELVQALAICAGLCKEEWLHNLQRQLTEKQWDIPCTLSHSIFKYEALLLDNQYIQYVRDDIAQIWGDMLCDGATSFWETQKGASDFQGAGSLCHGWSAIPVYIYHKIQKL